MRAGWLGPASALPRRAAYISIFARANTRALSWRFFSGIAKAHREWMTAFGLLSQGRFLALAEGVSRGCWRPALVQLMCGFTGFKQPAGEDEARII